MKAKPVMTREVIYVGPHQPLSMAYRSMVLWKVRHMPVVERGKLVGILSDRDVLIHATRKTDEIFVPAMTVDDAMTASPITLAPDGTVSRAAELMLEYKIDALPIVSGEKHVGLVTSSDLLVLLIGNNERVDEVKLPFSFKLREAEA